jgi:hypothetical protein
MVQLRFVPLTLGQGMELERLPRRTPTSNRTGRAIGEVRRGAVVLLYCLGSDGASKGAGSTNLPDDDTARHYGQLIVREFKQRGGSRDPKMKLAVRNSTGDVVHVIPI